MKLLVLILFLGYFLMGCNAKTKDTVIIETIEITKDTIDTIEKDTLNISKDFVLGKFDYKVDSTFVKVSTKYANKTIYLKDEVYRAFLQMCDAATKDGISFKIISGTRNFYEQKAIWKRKWSAYKNLNPKERALKILEYSSMPSTSRHHWGTDIDLNSLNNSYFNSGKGLKEHKWLMANANSFGFYQVYTEKTNGRTGYQLEKWHWSYLPLASQYLAFYNANIGEKDISGFKGSELVSQLHIIENYVNGISEKAINYN
ncbi:M15 family metallopeptidase [Winogradskyella sp.]|uniref:M15 family metallopeptidase n=1 Tax=Winogradskyella sp. TaxID=1883156 RepID=UPI0026323439|nr:M15 family metallopeptidase [Winogradskyella sp.]